MQQLMCDSVIYIIIYGLLFYIFLPNVRGRWPVASALVNV